MRALLSVSDKTYLFELATRLHQLGFELISTGGTQKAISEYGLPVKNISEITHFPEILDGRVKTLHPAVHGGLLGQSSLAEHVAQMEMHQLERIDVLAVNLYPFKETLRRSDADFETCIENIDIGGPAMLRSAAKNFHDVIVLCDPADYLPVLDDWEQQSLSLSQRKALAAKVFRHCAAYDALIADFLTQELFPEKLTLTFEKTQQLRYGENPHQQAALYRHPLHHRTSGISNALQLHGKTLSYNNLQDANAALQLLAEFDDDITAVAVKHTNPCGVGRGNTAAAAFEQCYQADPLSIFGGIVAINAPVDEATALQLSDIFLEIVIAPQYSETALHILKQKKNLRILQIQLPLQRQHTHIAMIEGGLLVQESDSRTATREDLQQMSESSASEEHIAAALFLWKVVKHVKSNAIVVGSAQRTYGIGAGQMNRVGAASIALEQAGALAQGAVLVSDAFLPLRDTVDIAAKYGIRTIVQTGGSIKDADSIQAANEHGIALLFTEIRHFKH